MKRRDILKGLTLLPLSGKLLANGVADHNSGFINSPAGENIFRNIGVEPLINCRGTFTIIGGSLERASVRAAMEAASRNFVQYDELADGIGKKLAELTGAPWGMVSAGCAAGLKHITAACVTGGNPEKLIRIPDLTGMEKTEVIIPVSSRNVYDHAIRNIGVTIITVANVEELERSITKKTAMIYMTSEDSGFSLEDIVRVSKKGNIPVLVDAAAEDLTIPNIHLQKGATVVVYSGGKALCGPQCAGLVLGDKAILMSAWQASSPHHGPGRDNKVGREEMLGMVAAVETWVTMDHKAEWKKWIGWLDTISKKVTSVDGIKANIHEPTELSNHSPFLVISWDPAEKNLTGEEVAEELGRTKPRIAVGSGGKNRKEAGTVTSIDITTGQMQPDEVQVVADRIYALLSQKRTTKESSPKAAAGNIGGRWDVAVEFFSSTSKHGFYFEQDGNWIQGTHQGDFSVQELSGSIDGDLIKLRSVARRPGDHITYLFSGTLTGDTIKGSIYLGEYRTANFTATRNKTKGSRERINIPSGPPLAT
ncbi:MAG: selenocysteine synthase [Bacteroidota bacterium]